MNRKNLFLSGLVLFVGFMLAASPALAHNWGCWIQPNRTIYVRNTASNSSQANAAINEWNADTILTLNKVSYHTEISVFDGNYGNTGWGGLASIESYSGCTILHGHATVNTYYSYTSNGKRGVFCQEIGHLFGLDHSNDGGCMGGGYFYSIDSYYTVVSHNISDIASKYASVPAVTTGSELADRHGDEHADETPGQRPEVHAVWYHNPRTLLELNKLASAVVVARVSGVYEGAEIVVPAKGLDNDEHRVPTQRIAFDVERSVRGELEGTFDLFHTGSEDFVLAGDPAYQVGETYLLFVMPREDGSYLVVSPEGRYRLGRKGLEPVSTRSFAPMLGGTSVDAVASDLRQIVKR